MYNKRKLILFKQVVPNDRKEVKHILHSIGVKVHCLSDGREHRDGKEHPDVREQRDTEQRFC